MKKSKRYLITAIAFLLVISIPIISTVILLKYRDKIENTITNIKNIFDYARITEIDYKAILVDEPNNNKLIVTERLTYDVHAASKNNPFMELWHNLPETYKDGNTIKYKINSVKQILNNGNEIIYNESPKLYWNESDYTSEAYGPKKWFHSKGPYSQYSKRFESIFFYVDSIYREKITFEIEYEVYNIISKYNDASELYLSFFSGESTKYLKSFKAEILIPNKDMPSKENYEAHTYGTNYHSFNFIESKTKNNGYHTFSFELNKKDLKFKPYNQYIEFKLLTFGEDKHIFTDYATNNYRSHKDVLDEFKIDQEKYNEFPNETRRKKIKVLLISIISTSLLFIYPFLRDRILRKKYKFHNPTMQMQFFRDIPSNLDPYFAANLVFCKHKVPRNPTNGYSAIMLNLIRKGYIQLGKINSKQKWTSDNIKIIITCNPLYTSSQTLKNISPYLLHIRTTKLSKLMISTQPIQIQRKKFLHSKNVVKTIENLIEKLNSLEALTLTEEYYFNLIIKHSKGKWISINKFQEKISIDYENTKYFVKNVKNSIVNIGMSQGYFQKIKYRKLKTLTNIIATIFKIIGFLIIIFANIISYPTPLGFAFGSFFILGIGFILNSKYLNKLSGKYILLTQYGEDEYAKWRGLYNFLNSETLMKERTVIELPIWEKYLVYSTAFGISEKVIKALKIRCKGMELSPMLNTPYYYPKNFNTSIRTINSKMRSSSFPSNYSSFSNSHRTVGNYVGGRYGGGGAGGGGGGGGHGRH